MRRLLALITVLFLTAATIPRRGAEIHISFSGIICHVFDGTHAPRAVAVRGTADMLHRATLHVAQASIASSEVAMTCANGDCVVELNDTALRFPGAGRAHFDRGGSFDTIVPHLRPVTGGEMQSLRAEVYAVPSGVVSASMELPGGRMSASPYDVKAHYDPDFEARGERQFAREVFLDGMIPSPTLLVRRDGDRAWRSITFKEGLIELRMINEPAPDAMPMRHETLFYDLAELPLGTKPLIVSGETRTQNITVACSNSQYP